MKKNFVTLFPECPNVGLVKDVGMVPYCLSKDYGYNCTLASYEIDKNGLYIDENLKIKKIKRIFNNSKISGLIYLLFNSKKIDVLNIYHNSPKRNEIWSYVYKKLNPNGIIYLKLDMGIDAFLKQKEVLKTKGISDKIDIISVENEQIRIALKKECNINTVLIPNGFMDYGEESDLADKENILLTVARLGNEAKATDTLLEAFRTSANLHNWKLKLVGSIEPQFQVYINTFFEAYPDMKERVEFTGEINNRIELEKEYSKAKVFILPSRHEGFPLVLPEAMKNGCYLILSDMVSPACQLTQNGLYGEIVKCDDIQNISQIIANTCNMQIDWKQKAESIKYFAYDNLPWQKICDTIDCEIKRLLI